MKQKHIHKAKKTSTMQSPTCTLGVNKMMLKLVACSFLKILKLNLLHIKHVIYGKIENTSNLSVN